MDHPKFHSPQDVSGKAKKLQHLFKVIIYKSIDTLHILSPLKHIKTQTCESVLNALELVSLTGHYVHGEQWLVM